MSLDPVGLNLIERWFKELADRRLRRGAFTSVAELVDAIELWTEHGNDDPKPFVWHKTATEIIEKSAEDAPPSPNPSATHHQRRWKCLLQLALNATSDNVTVPAQ